MNRKQLILVFLALIVLVLLFILPKQLKHDEVAAPVAEKNASDDLKTHVDEIVLQLDSNGQMLAKRYSQASNSQSDISKKISFLDSLIILGDLYQKPLVGAYYAGKKIDFKADKIFIREAADRYFFATNSADEHLKSHLFEKASEFYTLVLKTDSADIDAKINLAVCYVESSKDPMKGIGLLREVLETDSNNIKAHLNLGYFAIKSGQFDKAIARFEKVLKIDPKQNEALLYLGDVYESKGEITKAIEYYELYKASLTDKAIAIEVQAYIEKLKNKV